MKQINNSDRLISEQEYNLLMGAKPFTPELNAIKFESRKETFQLVKDENIEFRYLNGSCEDRAHYISLLLRKYGVDCGKVWNFSPARYTFLSNELLNIKDPFGITDDLTWGYHVAPYLMAYNEQGEIEKLVVDQSFCEDEFLTESDWIARMNCQRAIQLHTDLDSYLFNSIFGYVGDHITSFETHYGTPLDIPSIITGNFWQLFPEDDYVQKGLAINDLAVKIFDFKNYLPQIEKNYLSDILNNIDDLIKLVVTQKPHSLDQDSYNHIINYYFERYYHWGSKLSTLC